MKRKLIGLAIALGFIAVPLMAKLLNAKSLKQAELGTVVLKQIQPSILATGTLVFRQEVQLSSEVTGKVVEVLVKEGDRIVRGQVLLRLDPTTYRAEVDQQDANRRSAEIAVERARLNLANEQRNLDRTARLSQAKYINASKYDEATHQMEVAQIDLRSSREALQQAQAMLALARERLAKTEVRSPIDGTVVAVQIKAGETAVASVTGIAGSSLMTIADMGSIMAEVNVDEADIAGITRDQHARVFPSAFPDKPLEGTVESVSLAPKVGTQGRSYLVKLRLKDSSLALRTGMTCRAEIVVSGGTPRPAIPLQAILTEQTGGAKEKTSSYVLAVVDGAIRKTPVELGLADDTNREVLKGLKTGDMFAVGPARLLRELREGEEVTALKDDSMQPDMRKTAGKVQP